MTESYRFSGEAIPAGSVFEEAEASTRSQKRAQRTRRRLLAAALTLFSERGMDAATIEDITEQADLGKGTFYRHFTNKEELAETLLDSILGQLIQLLHGGKKALPGLKEALERIFEVHARFFARQQNATLLLFDWLIKLHLRDSIRGRWARASVSTWMPSPGCCNLSCLRMQPQNHSECWPQALAGWCPESIPSPGWVCPTSSGPSLFRP